MRCIPTALGLALSLIACAGSTEHPEQATVRDSAGIEIVDNHAPSWPEGLGRDGTMEPVLSLDDSIATGGVPYVSDALLLPNGEFLVVAEAQARWFDGSGALLRTIGRAGEGPGEFRGINQVMLRGDTVLLSGYSNTSKIAFFGPDGSHLRDELLDRERFRALGRWSECQTYVLPDGSRLSCMMDSTIPLSATNRVSQIDDRGWSSPGPGLLRQMQRIHLVPATLDTTYPMGIDIGIEQFGVDMGGGEVNFIVHPMYARSQIAFGGAPMRIAIGTNPAWEVEFWTPDGTLERIVRLEGGRRAPTPEEVTAATRQLREQELSRARDTASIEKALALVPAPDSLPGMLILQMSRAGELAVARGGLFVRGFPTLYDFFDAGGRWTGMREMPPRWRLLDFDTDHMLGVRYDDDDLPHVELYDRERAAP